MVALLASTPAVAPALHYLLGAAEVAPPTHSTRIIPVPMTPWRNGSGLDSNSKGWGFESLWGHFLLLGKIVPEVGFEPTRTYAHLNLSQAP